MKKIIFLFTLCLLILQAGAQTTKIYIVRHGEKNVDNPTERDPVLSAAGMERANALSAMLNKKKVSAIFSTNYKRTKDTGAPLALKNKLTIETYNPSDVKTLVEKIKKEYAGKTVLIVGHSNTVLELTEAFGAKRPLPLLTDDDYDNLFLVTIDGAGINATSEKFGKPHHAGS